MPARRDDPCAATRLELSVRGLSGGHSGLDIHHWRGNAILMAAELAAATGGRLVSLEGGERPNVIPYQASAVVVVPDEALETARRAAEARAEGLRVEYQWLETNMQLSVRQVAPDATSPPTAFSVADTQRLLRAMRVLPHGVLKMSHAIPGLVETSNNVASARTSDDGLQVLMTTRSSLSPALEVALDRLEAVAHLSGGTLERRPTFPGWAPDPSSRLLALAKQELRGRLQHEPEVLAPHAGLECGLLLEKCPTLKETISIGPTIVHAHSPKEAVEVATVEPFFQALMGILAVLARAKS